MNANSESRAVIMGAGIAGLCAAAALSRVFDKVVVLERDSLEHYGALRPGAPQARHPHVLLCGGLEAMEDVLPGFSIDLLGAGGRPLSATRDMRLEFAGIGTLPQADGEFVSFAQARPVLEAALYGRVAALAGVQVIHGVRNAAILTSADRGRVAGARYDGASGAFEILADLVVDATGRGRLTEDVLQAAGAPPPERTVVGIDLGYATGVFHIPPRPNHGFQALATFPRAPDSTRGAYMVRVGESAWQVLLVGRGEEQPPGDLEGFLAFADQLPTHTVSNLLRRASPPAEIHRFRFPESQWRHYGRAQLPRGLVVIGDALSRFNPVYGQGMTAAALEARLLGDMMAPTGARPAAVAEAAAAFQTRVEDLVAEPWALSVTPDFVYPLTVGDRPADLPAQLGAHRARLEAAMAGGPALRDHFHRQQLVALARAFAAPEPVRQAREPDGEKSPATGPAPSWP